MKVMGAGVSCVLRVIYRSLWDHPSPLQFSKRRQEGSVGEETAKPEEGQRSESQVTWQTFCKYQDIFTIEAQGINGWRSESIQNKPNKPAMQFLFKKHTHWWIDRTWNLSGLVFKPSVWFHQSHSECSTHNIPTCLLFFKKLKWILQYVKSTLSGNLWG